MCNIDKIEDVLPNNTNPRIAVLIAVHAGANEEHFDAAVKSIIDQTYTNTHIYLYADGPLTSGQEDVAAKYLRSDTGQDQFVRGTRPRGLAVGLNCLIEAALSDPSIEYFVRMDADDICVPQRFERQVDFMDANRSISVSGTWCIEFSVFGRPTFHKKLPTTPERISLFMVTRSGLIHPSVIIRREVLEAGHRYNASIIQAQDLELWCRLLLDGNEFANLPEYLLWYRVASSSFYSRRAGWSRGWLEVKLHLTYAWQAKLLRPEHLIKLALLFILRVSPESVKRFAYARLRR